MSLPAPRPAGAPAARDDIARAIDRAAGARPIPGNLLRHHLARRRALGEGKGEGEDVP